MNRASLTLILVNDAPRDKRTRNAQYNTHKVTRRRRRRIDRAVSMPAATSRHP